MWRGLPRVSSTNSTNISQVLRTLYASQGPFKTLSLPGPVKNPVSHAPTQASHFSSAIPRSRAVFHRTQGVTWRIDLFKTFSHKCVFVWTYNLRPGNGQIILEDSISHEDIGLALCFILFLKRNSSGICLVKYFPAVFDRSTVQWDIDLYCRGYQSIHAMTDTEQDNETYWMWGQATELLWVLGPQLRGFDDFWLN